MNLVAVHYHVKADTQRIDVKNTVHRRGRPTSHHLGYHTPTHVVLSPLRPPIANGLFPRLRVCHEHHSWSTGVTKTTWGPPVLGKKGEGGDFRLRPQVSVLEAVLPVPAVLGHATGPVDRGVAMTITTRSGIFGLRFMAFPFLGCLVLFLASNLLAQG